MPKIVVRYIIPTGTLSFYHWAPVEGTDILVRETVEYRATLWSNRTCLGNEDDDFERTISVYMDKVFVDVEIFDVPEAVVRFIYDERDRFRGKNYGVQPEDENYDCLNNAYLKLDVTALKAAFAITNRLLSYARNYKSHHWLSERELDEKNISSRNNEFNAKVSSDDFDWVRWGAHNQMYGILKFPSQTMLIKKEEWDKVKEYVKADSKPNLTFELLANTRVLQNGGYRRSAIIEALSALEIAVYEFSKAPKLEQLLTTNLANRIDANSLNQQVKHLGFSGTIRYLVPVLFSAEVLPREVLDKCYQAIQVRNNVVHNGQRDVKVKQSDDLIAGVSRLCKVLIEYTKGEV